MHSFCQLAEKFAESNVPLLGMATGESLAHLNHLIGQGLASAERDAAGVIWYRQTAPEA